MVNEALGALRAKIGHEKGFVQPGWRPLWVLDFPMFEWNEEEKRWDALHHPFTAPMDGHEEYLDSDPGKALSKAYDMVLNGWEIGGGSVRIHRQDVQSKVFCGAQHRAGGGAQRSSDFCSTRCSTARRPTAASPSAWIASSR